MLTIVLDKTDDHDSVELTFEHSLVSLSKWEAMFEKPFFGREPMSGEEALTYFELMLVSTPPFENWVTELGASEVLAFNDYINSKQTATTIKQDSNQRPSREIITSELIYHWMIDFGIPFHPCETWHLNRLMTLIQVRGIKQTKPKQMSRRARQEEFMRLNAQRKAQLGTNG